MRRFLSILAFVFWAGLPGLRAQGTPLTRSKSIKDIKSDQLRLEFREQKMVTILEGSIHVIADRYHLRADYAEGHQGEEGTFVMGFATGNVRIYIDDGTMLQGNWLNYDRETGKLLLVSQPNRPNPRTWRGGKVISAKEIIYNLGEQDENRRLVYQGDVHVTDGEMPAEYFKEYPAKAPGKSPSGTGQEHPARAPEKPPVRLETEAASNLP